MALRKAFKLGTAAGISGYTAYVLAQNDWNMNNIGIVRFGRAAVAVGSIAFDYRSSVYKLRDDSHETIAKWSACHRRSAERLLKLCCDNGGVFIKVGQHIAALDYLVPAEYVDTLKVLHNRGPISTLDEVRNVIHTELKCNVEDIFSHFDCEPVGAASLAQVYRATLKETGEEVAVKVQHSRVFRHSLVDMATMEILFTVISKVFSDFNFMWLAELTRHNLPLELNFVHEGENAELMANLLADFEWLKIPKIHWKYTTKRTLVMEYHDGQLISNKTSFMNNKIDCAQLAERLELIYSRMIFVDGVIHCDPHPGNIIVKNLPGGRSQMVLLDHGLYSTLTDDFRRAYIDMWLAILKGDVAKIRESAMKMGIKDEIKAGLLACMISSKPWSAIERGLENIPDAITKAKERGELRENAARYMNTISQVLATMDRQLLLVLKTNDLIRSIANYLGTDERRTFLTMTRCCLQAKQKLRLAECDGFFSRLAVRLQTQWLLFKISLFSLYLSFTKFS